MLFLTNVLCFLVSFHDLEYWDVFFRLGNLFSGSVSFLEKLQPEYTEIIRFIYIKKKHHSNPNNLIAISFHKPFWRTCFIVIEYSTIRSLFYLCIWYFSLNGTSSRIVIAFKIFKFVLDPFKPIYANFLFVFSCTIALVGLV